MKPKTRITLPKLTLPALRGRIGDRYYYSCLMTFEQIALRVKLPEEIDEHENDENKLGDWLQRELKSDRTAQIVAYLKREKQRFFNTIILGMYGGEPIYQNLQVTSNEAYDNLSEDVLMYFSKTFGVITLSGEESIFAIDGQHRARAIKLAMEESPILAKEEVSVIFVAHNTSEEGKERTRRLFSTLNRYAKPVNKKEIIALSEDDNCAIITRRLTERFALLKNRVLISGNKSVGPTSKNHFTSIIMLYEIVERVLTDRRVPGIAPSQVTGYGNHEYTNNRASAKAIDGDFKKMTELFTEIIDGVPSLRGFFRENIEVDRNSKGCSLLFRPIGQVVLFNVLKAATIFKKRKQAIEYFAKDDFNLNHKVWGVIFWESDSDNIAHQPFRQRYASLLIMERLGVPIKRTRKDLEILSNFKFAATDI